MESSLQKRLLQSLQSLDRKEISTFHVVMLPDFFVDHFVSLDTVEKTCNAVKTVAAQGGGNLPGIAQWISQGGNAANTALALARLGISAHLICRTNILGMYLLQYFLGNSGVDLSGVKTDGNLAITTALEFHERHANIMIGDPGSVANFTFDSLNDHDRELITSADLVGVTNWNLNRSGTDLACKVFELAKKHEVRTFFDSGDPSPRVSDIPDLMKKVLSNPQLDIFGLNENELRYYSNSSNKTEEEMISAVVLLKKKISARIDLHTSLFSSSICNNSIVVPSMSLSTVYRSTGAGDAWNAANLFADLLGFEDDERLLFANMFAGYYISSPDVVHLTIDMLINFIKNSL
jgi:sugar/nucleoside kinase (ribokinase family)